LRYFKYEGLELRNTSLKDYRHIGNALKVFKKCPLLVLNVVRNLKEVSMIIISMAVVLAAILMVISNQPET